MSDKSVGQIAYEALTKEFADMTAHWAELGFGEKYVDFREPSTKVELFKKAEKEALITYNGKTSEEIKAEAEKFHKKTPKKFLLEGKEIPEGYYDDENTSSSNPDDKEDNPDNPGGTTIIEGTGENPSNVPGPPPDIPGFFAETPPAMTVEEDDEEETSLPVDTSDSTEEPKKSFDDYTEEELNNLSEEELNNLLDPSNNENP